MWLQELLYDLRHSLRGALRRPGFTCLAIAIPALAIAANSAVFSVLDATMIRPLPYPESGCLVSVFNVGRDGERDSVSPADYLDWKEQSDALAEIAAYQPAPFTLLDYGEPRRLGGIRTSAAIFPILGLPPALGRPFTAEEDQPGAQPVVLLSHSLWRSLLGARTDIVGQDLRLNGTPHRVIGVLPREWRFPSAETELVIPLALTPEQKIQRTSFYLSTVARLEPGWTLARANESLRGLVERLRGEVSSFHDQGVVAESLQQVLGDRIRPLAALLQGAAALLLLAACGNPGKSPARPKRRPDP
jgi:hypothetical protein